MYNRILVPVDGSPPANRGLQEAIRIAKFTGATLRLVHVVNELFLAPAYISWRKYDDLLAGLLEQGKRTLADATALARGGGVNCEDKLIEAMSGEQAATAILQQVREWLADLIVMGTHGRRGLRRLALGSDAEIVLRYSPVPLLLVRDAPEQG